MKISWRAVLCSVLAYAIFLLATLPADQVLPRLQSRGIVASGVTGSVWTGKAAALQVGQLAFGEIDWNVSALRLLTGQLSVHLHTHRQEGALQATVSVGLGKRVSVRRLQGVQPIGMLAGIGAPGGWDGTVQFNVSELELENYWPVRIQGSIDAKNLAGPANQPMQIGSFRVDFAGDEARDGPSGTLTSAGDGPYDVTGTLRLQPNRNYSVEARVAVHPGAPASTGEALQYLGPADAQGMRQFSMAGRM